MVMLLFTNLGLDIDFNRLEVSDRIAEASPSSLGVSEDSANIYIWNDIYNISIVKSATADVIRWTLKYNNNVLADNMDFFWVYLNNSKNLVRSGSLIDSTTTETYAYCKMAFTYNDTFQLVLSLKLWLGSLVIESKIEKINVLSPWNVTPSTGYWVRFKPTTVNSPQIYAFHAGISGIEYIGLFKNLTETETLSAEFICITNGTFSIFAETPRYPFTATQAFNRTDHIGFGAFITRFSRWVVVKKNISLGWRIRFGVCEGGKEKAVSIYRRHRLTHDTIYLTDYPKTSVPIYVVESYHNWTVAEIKQAIDFIVDEIGAEALDINYGWQSHRGDWMSPRINVTEIINYAHSKGLKVILWFEPLHVDQDSDFATKYPDMLIHNQDGTIYSEGSYYFFGVTRNLTHLINIIKFWQNKGVDWFDGGGSLIYIIHEDFHDNWPTYPAKITFDNFTYFEYMRNETGTVFACGFSGGYMMLSVGYEIGTSPGEFIDEEWKRFYKLYWYGKLSGGGLMFSERTPGYAGLLYQRMFEMSLGVNSYAITLSWAAFSDTDLLNARKPFWQNYFAIADIISSRHYLPLIFDNKGGATWYNDTKSLVLFANTTTTRTILFNNITEILSNKTYLIAIYTLDMNGNLKIEPIIKRGSELKSTGLTISMNTNETKVYRFIEYNDQPLVIYKSKANQIIRSQTFTDQRLHVVLEGPTGVTGTTVIYCPYEPVAIYEDGELKTTNYVWNPSTKLLTINVTFSSPVKLDIYFAVPKVESHKVDGMILGYVFPGDVTVNLDISLYTYTGEAVSTTTRITVEVYDSSGNLVYSTTKRETITQQPKTVTVNIPSLETGTYIVKIKLENPDTGEVLDTYSFLLKVTYPWWLWAAIISIIIATIGIAVLISGKKQNSNYLLFPLKYK